MNKKIKAAVSLKNKSLDGLAKEFNISRQALSNKLYRNSFSAKDLCIIANYLDCELAFIDDKNKIVLNIE